MRRSRRGRVDYRRGVLRDKRVVERRRAGKLINSRAPVAGRSYAVGRRLVVGDGRIGHRQNGSRSHDVNAAAAPEGDVVADGHSVHCDVGVGVQRARPRANVPLAVLPLRIVTSLTVALNAVESC